MYCNFDHDVTRLKRRINAGVSCTAPDGDEQRRNHLPLGQSTTLRDALTHYSVKRGIGCNHCVPAVPKMFPEVQSTENSFTLFINHRRLITISLLGLVDLLIDIFQFKLIDELL